MKAVKRSEFCKKDTTQASSVPAKKLGLIGSGVVFRGSIQNKGGIWLKANYGTVLLTPDKSSDRFVNHPKSGDLFVSGYKKLNVTLVIEDE